MFSNHGVLDAPDELTRPNISMVILQGKIPQGTLRAFDTLTQTFQNLSLRTHVRQHIIASSRLQSQVAVHPFKGDLDTLDALARAIFALDSLDLASSCREPMTSLMSSQWCP